MPCSQKVFYCCLSSLSSQAELTTAWAVEARADPKSSPAIGKTQLAEAGTGPSIAGAGRSRWWEPCDLFLEPWSLDQQELRFVHFPGDPRQASFSLISVPVVPFL